MKLHHLLPLIVALAAHAADPQPVAAPGLENVFKLDDRVLSGNSPHDEAGFATLKKLDIKTIVSVDGAPPDAALARKHGMRYIHLPVGYDGVKADTQHKLVKAGQTAEGPIYVHCHHGKHRGPAAAAVMCQGIANWSPQKAADFLKQAGTSPDYAGLYKASAEFKAPTAEQLRAIPAELPERTAVAGMADAMIAVGEHFDHLKLLQKSAWRAPATHPDLVPKTEAVLVMEAFCELQRGKESKKLGADYLALLAKSEAAAKSLHEALAAPDIERAAAAMRDLTQQCSQCHKMFRN